LFIGYGIAGSRAAAIDSGSRPVICRAVTRQEIEQKMDESAREYRDTHDPEIPEEIFELARRLRELDH
jgi:hypothetical protein